ncbi:hypothetical protein Pr1d_45020 [Bythopirellula goksoeyrii]|uniref:Uncharacterized protein n=1 Tax=Bythopirellula goksoeyrii TaxID=1400387 RepID=A0A5B9QSN9_9BACT|nr:hypothetical protein Pr1d_45020 [Bythopirellula goksoeyrii]
MHMLYSGKETVDFASVKTTHKHCHLAFQLKTNPVVANTNAIVVPTAAAELLHTRDFSQLNCSLYFFDCLADTSKHLTISLQLLQVALKASAECRFHDPPSSRSKT